MTISTSPPFRILLILLGALGASARVHAEDTPPKCTYVEVASLPIHYVGEGLEPAVDGTINGTPAMMLIDTGCYRKGAHKCSPIFPAPSRPADRARA